MVLSAVAVLPHGAMLLDPSLPDLPPLAKELHHKMHQASEKFNSAESDIIIIISPHGIALSEAMSIYTNSKVEGSAEWLGNWKGFKASMDCDTDSAGKLLHHLRKEGVKADSITSFSRGVAAPLAWGEVVPLWFLKNNPGFKKDTKVIVGSWPLKRFDGASYRAEARRIGELLHDFAQQHSQRVGVVLSCDLSHVHGTPAGTHPLFSGDASMGEDKHLAEGFDSDVDALLRSMEQADHRHAESALDMLSLKVNDAKACGWSGICALVGCWEAICKYDTNCDFVGNGRAPWIADVYFNGSPTYYGMAAATYLCVDAKCGPAASY
jgi:aromatic ring-opening dioxygenase LigB subunit